MSVDYTFYVKRRLSAENIAFSDENRAIESLSKCVCGIGLVRTYLEIRGKNDTIQTSKSCRAEEPQAGSGDDRQALRYPD
jgi:hypothetical protein